MRLTDEQLDALVFAVEFYLAGPHEDDDDRPALESASANLKREIARRAALAKVKP